MQLCQTFRELAAQTWRRMEAAERAGLFWSEETNTESLLLALAERHPGAVRVKAFLRHEEARNGADWEWWIGGRGSWLGMRVQAKRLNIPSERFHRLQSYRARRQPRRQIDTLIDAAKNEQLTPAYCLYVFSHRWQPAPLVAPLEVPHFGCLIAHASAVRAVGRETLRAVAAVAAPWHALVCPWPFAPHGHPEAAHAHSMLRQSVAAALPEGFIRAAPDDPDFPLFPPSAELPEYMLRLAHDEPDDELLRARALEQGLAGYLLLDTSRLD